ncbi:MAG: ACT domain-containing protein [Bacillota bacterium]
MLGVDIVDGGHDRFYVVSSSILPETILKTALAKKLLAKGEAATVHEAVEKIGLSRSAFYKYKEGIFPLHDATSGKIVTFSMHLEHRAGILSQVLNTIAQAQGNILTINQGLPLQGVAHVTIAMETAEMRTSLEEVLMLLSRIEGVKNVEIVGQS